MPNVPSFLSVSPHIRESEYQNIFQLYLFLQGQDLLRQLPYTLLTIMLDQVTTMQWFLMKQ